MKNLTHLALAASLSMSAVAVHRTSGEISEPTPKPRISFWADTTPSTFGWVLYSGLGEEFEGFSARRSRLVTPLDDESAKEWADALNKAYGVGLTAKGVQSYLQPHPSDRESMAWNYEIAVFDLLKDVAVSAGLVLRHRTENEENFIEIYQ